ncbi:MAG: putative deacylase [Candidatus Paceibacteria bacterium]|jgi:predicted deacylase
MNQTTKVLIGVVTLLIFTGVIFMTFDNDEEPVAPIPIEPVIEEIITAAPTPTSTERTIGNSVQGRSIRAYTYGTGETDILFVGGMHGGYEWNSILLAYETIDHLKNNSDTVPDNVTVHIIPNLNPDGLFAATGLEERFTANDIPNNSMHTSGIGRFNANDVDLNRNFDCKWAPKSSWRGEIVSAGTSAFSEPEAETLRNYVTTVTPEAVIFWHSKANNVYASECENGILPETLTLMQAYSIAGEYGAVPVFDAYQITGDAEGWLASIGIPAITVELGSRTSIEWTQNLAGVNAILNMYGNK